MNKVTKCIGTTQNECSSRNHSLWLSVVFFCGIIYIFIMFLQEWIDNVFKWVRRMEEILNVLTFCYLKFAVQQFDFTFMAALNSIACQRFLRCYYRHGVVVKDHSYPICQAVPSHRLLGMQNWSLVFYLFFPPCKKSAVDVFLQQPIWVFSFCNLAPRRKKLIGWLVYTFILLCYSWLAAKFS